MGTLKNNPALALIEKWQEEAPDEETVDFYEFGPGHIVISDYNLLDEHIVWCMERIINALSIVELTKEKHSSYTEYLAEIAKDVAYVAGIFPSKWSTGRRIEMLGKTYRLLEDLLAIPEEERIAGTHNELTDEQETNG